MIDDEETEAGDADNAEMSGEPDVAKLRLVSVPAGVLEDISPAPGMLVVSYPKDFEVPREANATDRVLLKVRQRRQQHDESEGYFRDYKDGTGRPSDAQAVLVAASAHEEAMKAVRVTWRHKFDVAVTAAMVETNEKRLPGKLTEVAAIVTAWQEAIELRGSKARILAEQGAVRRVQKANGQWKTVHLMPWWRRLLKALRFVN